MDKNLIKISTVNMSREEWLEHRRNAIGGSDAAALVGMNPYSSPYSVWADKLGKLAPTPDNEAMKQGRDLESYVAQRFTEKTGKKVQRENAIIYNPKYPWAHANIDRKLIGEDAILECKTCSALSMKKFKNGEYPSNYYTQVVHYMAVTGASKAYIAVVVLGKEFLVFEVERDEDEIAALMKAEEEFWQLVKNQTPPPADGSEATTETIKTIYSESGEGECSLFGFDAEINQYIELGKRIKELTELQSEYANRIKSFMGEAARGESQKYKVSWASGLRSTFDSKRFALEHPELDLSGYYKTTSTRTFRITEKK